MDSLNNDLLLGEDFDAVLDIIKQGEESAFMKLATQVIGTRSKLIAHNYAENVGHFPKYCR